MFKLTVVDGPNRGSSYMLQNGENWIGRQNGNLVTLQSSKISKRHCVLIAKNGELLIKDEGSANGTFVNGVLTKLKKVVAGDRISVGDYVFEISEHKKKAKQKAPAIAGIGNMNNVVKFPVQAQPGFTQNKSITAASIGSAGIQGTFSVNNNFSNQAPQDLPGKLNWYFDRFVMPPFHRMNLRTEWKTMTMGVLGVFVFTAILVTIQPILEANKASLAREAMKRARFMTQQIAERNTAFLAAGAETKTEIGSIENERDVRIAVLIDLESRILAPSSKINQYLTDGSVAAFAVGARNRFNSGQETGYVSVLNSTTIAAVEPVKVLSAQAGKNKVVAMAIVALDSTRLLPGSGEVGMIFSQTLIIVSLLAGLAFLVIYKLTLRPFEILNEDMDKVLKGELNQVTHEFKFGELNALWDLINTSLQRIPKSTGGMGFSSSSEPLFDAEDYASSFRQFGELYRCGVLICDAERKVLYMNSMFEEMSGIRSENALGQDITQMARDQAFGAFVIDMFGKVSPGGESMSEDFDFSGITYKMHVSAMGRPGTPVKCYGLIAVRSDGS
jgi:PAS domain-containing protein